MHQLSSLDAQLLDAETSTTFTHVGVLSVLGPTTPDCGLAAPDLRALVGNRLHLVGPLRWLQEVPLGLDLPDWVDSESLDLGYHVREATLPGPGTSFDQVGHQLFCGVRSFPHAHAIKLSRPMNAHTPTEQGRAPLVLEVGDFARPREPSLRHDPDRPVTWRVAPQVLG